jgi:hypothetical protein
LCSPRQAGGHITDAEVLANQDRLRADPHFEAHFRQLLDCRRVCFLLDLFQLGYFYWAVL